MGMTPKHSYFVMFAEKDWQIAGQRSRFVIGQNEKFGCQGGGLREDRWCRAWRFKRIGTSVSGQALSSSAHGERTNPTYKWDLVFCLPPWASRLTLQQGGDVYV